MASFYIDFFLSFFLLIFLLLFKATVLINIVVIFFYVLTSLFLLSFLLFPVTSMVPSSLLARRPATKTEAGPSSRGAASSAPGFGLVPRSVSAGTTTKAKEEAVPGGSGGGRGTGTSGGGEKEVGDDSYEAFMNSMKELGAM
jgi:hypothetical protein